MQIQEMVVKSCTAGNSSQGTVYTLTTECGNSVQSLVSELVGARIMVRKEKGYFINSVMHAPGTYVTKGKSLGAETKYPTTQPASTHSTSKSGWKENLPPYTPEQVAVIMHQVVRAAEDVNLFAVLPADVDKTSIISCLFIAATKPQTYHVAPEIPSIQEYSASLAFSFMESLDAPDNTNS